MLGYVGRINDKDVKRIDKEAYGGTHYASLSVKDYAGAGDANRDFVTNCADIHWMGRQWLQVGVSMEQDLDRNGRVNMVDFALLAEQWGWQS